MSHGEGFRRRTKPSLRLISAFCFLLSAFFGCTSSTPKTPPKPLTSLPAAALDVMCARLRAEGMTSELRVVKETQSIITPQALQGLADASFARGAPRRDALASMLSTPLIPIDTNTTSCGARFVSAADAAKAHDVMLLQFSSPFVNPWGRGESGTLVRMSLGGESATWYWIPLISRGDQWFAGPPLPLAFIE